MSTTEASTTAGASGKGSSSNKVIPGGKDSEQKKPEKPTFPWGILLAAISGVLFAAGSLVVKFLRKNEKEKGIELPGALVAFYRYLGMIFVVIPMLLERPDNWFGPPPWTIRLWLVMRAVFGSTGIWFKFMSLSYISMATDTIISLSSPIFVFIFARIFLGEHFGRYHVLALVLSLVGILLASNLDDLFRGDASLVNATTISPDGALNETLLNLTTTSSSSDLDDSSTQQIASTQATTVGGKMLGVLCELIATVLASLVFIFIRKMSHVHHTVIMFNLALIGMFELGLIILAGFGGFQLPVQGWSPYLLVALSGTACYAQVFFTQAVQKEEAGIVSIIRGGTEAVFAFVSDVAFLGESVSIMAVLGALLVMAAVILITFRKYVLNLPPESPIRKRFNFLQ